MTVVVVRVVHANLRVGDAEIKYHVIQRTLVFWHLKTLIV